MKYFLELMRELTCYQDHLRAIFDMHTWPRMLCNGNGGFASYTDWPFAQYPDISATQKVATLIESPRLKNQDFETQNIKA